MNFATRLHEFKDSLVLPDILASEISTAIRMEMPGADSVEEELRGYLAALRFIPALLRRQELTEDDIRELRRAIAEEWRLLIARLHVRQWAVTGAGMLQVGATLGQIRKGIEDAIIEFEERVCLTN